MIPCRRCKRDINTCEEFDSLHLDKPCEGFVQVGYTTILPSPPPPVDICPLCHGNGVLDQYNPLKLPIDCPQCMGTGKKLPAM